MKHLTRIVGLGLARWPVALGLLALMAFPTPALSATCSVYQGQATINELRIGESNETDTANQVEIYNSGNVAESVWRTWTLKTYHEGSLRTTTAMSSTSQFRANGQFIYNNDKALFLENRSGGKHDVEVVLTDASGAYIDYVLIGTTPTAALTPPACLSPAKKATASSSSKDKSGNLSRTTDGGSWPSAVTGTSSHTIGKSNNCNASGNDLAVAYSADQPSPVVNTTTVNYTLTVSNKNCSSSVSGIKVTATNISTTKFTINTTTGYATTTPANTGTRALVGNNLEWSNITLAAGASATLTITGKPKVVGTLSSVASITLPSGRVNTTDDTATEVINVVDYNYVGFDVTTDTLIEGTDLTYEAGISTSVVSNKAVTVNYTVSCPLCSGDTNLPASGSLTLPANDGTGLISFTITDDSAYEPNKTIVITINSISSIDTGVRLSTPDSALTLTLQDDDAPPAEQTTMPLYLLATGVPSSTLSNTAANATTLLNYDSGRDAFAGLLIQKGAENAEVSDPVKYQRWLSGSSVVHSGSLELRFWSAMKDFNNSKKGVVTAYLRDCNSSGIDCVATPLAVKTLTVSPWSGGSSTWVQKTLSFGNVNLNLGSTRRLELKLIVDSASDDDMWFAYGTTTFNTTLGAPLASAGPDHYELSLPSSGLACQASTVTVTACSNNSSPCTSAATTLSGQTATLSTSAGTLGSTSVTFNASGVATTTLSHPTAADAASVSVTLSGESTAATNARKCCADGASCTVGNSCSTTFNTAGLIYSSSANGSNIGSFPAQVAGTSSGTYYLRAVKTGTTTKACEAALTGAATVNWGVVCVNPASCSTGNLMSVTGNGGATAIAGNPNGTATSFTGVPMTFDANGSAPFSFTYNDAGRIRLDSKMTVNSATLSGLNSTSSHVTAPARFTVTNIKQTASPNLVNPGATSAAGSRFVKAGESFTATVTAQTTGGATTPNFGKESVPEGVLLTPTLVLPSGGASGSLSNGTIAGGSFSNGVATVTNLAYSEVGIVTLTSTVASGNYINTGGPVAATTTGNIGRFYPAQFALSGGTVTHRSGASCSPSSAFTYLGENFLLGLTLTAQNTAGATTANYSGAFAKLDPTSAAGWNVAGLGGTTTFSTGSGRLSLGTATGSWANGVASNIAITANATRASAADGPFNATFGVAPTDSDGVTMSTLNMASTSSGTADRTSVSTVPLRFGRLSLANAVGAQSRALSLPLTAQYWTGTAFDTNTLDSCTAIAATHVSFGNLRKTLTAADTSVSGSSFGLSSGVGALKIGAPLGGRYGTVDVTLSLGSSAADASCLQPWTTGSGDAATAGANLSFLRGAWCGSTYVNDPSARASFGLYRGADAMIFQRENY